MKKMIITLLVVTLLWYVLLFNLQSNTIGACVCPQVNEDTYRGPNWPTLLPEGGCGDCGLPESPSQFFSQLFIIALPAIMMVGGYGIYKVVKHML